MKGFYLGLVLGLAPYTPCHAEAPPEARLPAEPPVAWEKRLTDLEKRVDALEGKAKVAAPTATTMVIPPGFHAHTRTDGSVFVHSDALNNDAAAHAGVPWPWHKTAVAGQTVTTTTATTATAPLPAGVFVSPMTGRTYVPHPTMAGYYTESTSTETTFAPAIPRTGPLRALFQNGRVFTQSCPGGNCPR